MSARPKFGTALFLCIAMLTWPAGCDRTAAVNHADATEVPDAADPTSDAAGSSPGEAADRAVGNDTADETTVPARHTNRLARETSPYLLLHAHNPVDWYPWGAEALAKAQREGKPIFLSIGYSSCYWCHVIERESFMDEEIAALLNEHFVCIKVDREERPDVDKIYMTALQVYLQLAGSPGGGGWPLSIFLTPDAKPFMGGTYFPPRDRAGVTGFLTVVTRIDEVWRAQQDAVRQQADQLAGIVQEVLLRRPDETGVELSGELVDAVYASLVEQYDPEYGGFGFSATNPRQPKFPEPSNLVFLIDRIGRTDGDARQAALDILLATLDHMAAGGIRDHIGGGFHRYSTDRYWHIPHFEKMLYDNGQLASVYAEAYALTGDERYRAVVDQMLAFVLRELIDAEGGFYAALDAETGAEEGAFYRWTRDEFAAALPKNGYALAAAAYGIDGEPNFERFYVPLLRQPLAATAKTLSLLPEELEQRLRPLRAALLTARDRRARPLTDTKILTSWNGLMIGGFADAGRLLANPDYTAAAVRAAEFVLAHLRDEDGRLLRTYAGGAAKLNAYLDDYAFLVDGLIALAEATGDRRWLDEADQLTEMQIELFWDDTHGGFFFTSGDHETLIARSKDPVDSAIPSGNSVAADNLLYLAAACDKPAYRQRGADTLSAFAALMRDSPAGFPRMAVAAARSLEATDSPADPGAPPDGDASGATRGER